MKHRFFLTTLTIAATLLLSADVATAASQPNVIIVITDDQGYGDLSCHGNPVLQTPAMDKLHEQSVRLTNFHVDPTCAPTRGALLTGKYSHRARIWHTIAGGNCMRASETTMADIFKASGYRTGCFGKWHLGASYPYRPIDRGFEEWVGQGDGGTGTTADWFTNDRVNDMYIHNGEWEQYDGWAPDVFFEKAMDFMKDGDRPFFTYLATYIPHTPLTIPDKAWADKYRDKVKLNEAYFFACIEGVDRQIAKLDAFLHEEGLADNTILIFMTDNGATGGKNVHNAGMRGNKGMVYEGGHRVPFFIRWPSGKLAHGSDVGALTAHIDVSPTLIELCKLTPPVNADFDGRSFKELLYNPEATTTERSLVVEKQRTLKPEKYEKYAVMNQKWRLVKEQNDGAPELFDIAADPGQQTDVADKHPEIVESLLADYEQYWKHVSPGDRVVARPVIGTAHETETLLHASDLYAPAPPWNHAYVTQGRTAIAPYPIRIAESGTYRIEVRRWPREADAAMSGVPTFGKEVDAWVYDKPIKKLIYSYSGKVKALPVESVHLTVGAIDHTKPVSSTDTCTVFEASLKKGDYNLQADLLDKQGNPITSAYYVYVRNI
ncbi:arylsulfatase [Pontiellaceae bacterium B12227]|nr:arylsulfatase [Pontiellaceae bacterium B12227]